MRTKIKAIIYSFILGITILGVTGCTNEVPQVEEETVSEDVAEETPLYLIVENDTVEEELTVHSYVSGMEHHYKYSYTTLFMDKYGNYAPQSAFVAGKAIVLGERDADGYLTSVQMSDEVWEYEDVRRFSFDIEKGIFTIADTKYSIQDKYYVFSNGERTVLNIISEDDVLNVVGKDKKILSVVIATGHGELQLLNTEVFEGSFLQLNNDIFVPITENMYMEIPEGTYTLSVANDGWGGSKEIEILRGESTEVDLEELKGEGKKRGQVSFDIDVENVEVKVDYKIIDHTSPIELVYGTHVLEIKAEGYNTWKKYLSVNSPDSTIVIELEKDKEYKEETETEEVEETTEGEEETQESSENQ